MPQSPCSVPGSLCLGPNPSSERKYLRWGVGERNPRQRGVFTLSGYKRRLGRPEEAVRESGMEARDLPAGTSRREELSYDRTSGLSPNAGQPRGRSSVLPADGSVRMRTKVTVPGITSR